MALQHDLVEPLLTTALAKRGAGDDLHLDEVELIQVRPGRRCVLRYALTGRSGRLAVAGKIRTRGIKSRVERLAQTLRARGFREGGREGFVVAEPLGRVETLSMSLTRWYDGETSRESLERGAIAATRFAKIGAALARLHVSGVEVDRVHRLDDELAILDDDLGRAAHAQPERATRITRLLERARAVAARIEERTPVPIHRDFHPDQVVLAEAGPTLLDLDLFTMGDAHVDVANFVAHLREQGLREHGDSRRFAAAERAFLAGYAERDADDRAEASPALDAWIFLSLLRHLYVAWRIPARRGVLDALLGHCEALAEEQASAPTAGRN